ncbi:MarR family winged helix-turn-helix transcriptional regulator [Paraclostridium bifermentans]|uniref:MarR family winged helix-turn-helix transcriptional regulator n=1 Tax=Paraclostridium bifermentans TaxID=1490 RepID=UPI00359CA724
MNDSFKIVMLIREVYSKVMNKIEESLADSGLTHQQIMVLKIVAHNKEINITQLCNEMYLSKGTVSGIVNRLEKADYIKKVKYPEDKRNTYISFSNKGLEFAKEFRIKVEETFGNLFDNLTDKEKDEIYVTLNLIKEKLK